MQKIKEILIVGSGRDSLKGIDLKKLSQRMPVLTINDSVNLCPFGHYAIVVDKLRDKKWWNYNGQKIITLQQNETFFKLKNWNVHYVFCPTSSLVTEFNKEHYLTYKNFTFVSAFSWAFCSGFTNIYTAGIELDPKNWYYTWGGKREINKDLLIPAKESVLCYKELINKKGGDIFTFWKKDIIGLTYYDYSKMSGGK